jgi:hypothetical protein
MEKIFSAAVELPEADRAPFLERACGGDALLLAEVRDLLEADRQCGSLLAAVRRETQSLLKVIAKPADNSRKKP